MASAVVMAAGYWLTTPVDPNTSAFSLTDTITPLLPLLWGLRWRWIIPSLLVGLVLGEMFTHKWLRAHPKTLDVKD